MFNLIILLICLFSFKCESIYKYAFSKDQTYCSSIDTIKIISEIKKQYITINSKAAGYNKVEKDIIEQSAEGGIILALYDNSDLKKVITTYYGETGKAVTEYYFNSGSLFFAIKREYFYDKPIYEEGSNVAFMSENQYYFYKSTLFNWLDSNKKAVKNDSTNYKEEENSFMAEIKNLKEILASYKIASSKEFFGDTVRCKYGAKCPDTGYILRGSRNVSGRVIHVSPYNKKVPMEQ